MREKSMLIHPSRQQHLTQRLTRAGPELGQTAEGRPVVESGGVPLEFEVPLIHIHRGEASLQPAEIHRLGRDCGEGCPATFGMRLPSPSRILADDLPSAVLAKHHPDQPTLFAGQHQRARDRGLLKRDGESVARFSECFTHLSREECARCDDFAEHPVVGEPGRIPPVQLYFEVTNHASVGVAPSCCLTVSAAWPTSTIRVATRGL